MRNSDQSRVRPWNKRVWGVVVVGVVVLGAGLGLMRWKGDKPLQELKGGNYEIAINRGLGYLRNNEDRVSPYQWFLLDYLHRKFELGPEFSASNRKIQPPSEKIDAAKFQVFQRIAYPNELIGTLPRDDFPLPTARLLMAATHCDHIPLPKDIQSIIEQNLADGGYGVTYVALSLELMKENGCSLPAGEDRKLRDEAASGMVTIINDPASIPDMRYGAIAFLMHIHRRDLVERQWLDQVATEQNRDGGWRGTFDSIDSNDHATVMALWALLEYANPESADEPVLRRPML